MSGTPRVLTAAIIFLALLLTAAMPASANPDVGFRVTPTSIESTIAAGDNTSEIVTLTNFSVNEVVVRTHLTTDGGSAEPGISIEPGMLSLKPGESARVTVHIDVPAVAQTGKRLSSVLFDAKSSSEKDVSIVGQVAVVLSINVIHPVSDVTWSFPRIVDSTDALVFRMEGRNTGNFTTKLVGDARLKGIVRGDVDLQASSEPITIGESTTLQAVWDETPLFAIKRATLDLSSGIGAPVRTEATIFIFPWKLMLMGLFIAVLAFAGARLQPFAVKVYQANWRRTD